MNYYKRASRHTSEYLGHLIRVRAEFESTEERLKRGDWKSKVTGYTLILKNLSGGKAHCYYDIPDFDYAVDMGYMMIEEYVKPWNHQDNYF